MWERVGVLALAFQGSGLGGGYRAGPRRAARACQDVDDDEDEDDDDDDEDSIHAKLARLREGTVSRGTAEWKGSAEVERFKEGQREAGAGGGEETLAGTERERGK